MNNGLFRGFTQLRGIEPGKTYPDLETVYYDGTDRDLTAADINKIITTRSNSPVTLRLGQLPVRASECIFVKQKGDGPVTLVAKSGARIEGAFSAYRTRAKGSACGLMKEGPDASGVPVVSATYSRDWSDNTTTGQTLFGYAEPYYSMAATGGKFKIVIANNNGDLAQGRARFDQVPSHSDGEVECDITVPPVDPSWPGQRGIGIIFRTTNWANQKNGFGYLVAIGDGANPPIRLWKGDNGPGAGESILAASSPLTAAVGQSIRVKVTYYGTQIKVFVDGVEKLSVTDASYSSGQVGLQAGQLADVGFYADWYGDYTFDNFSCKVVTSTQGEEVWTLFGDCS